MSLQSDFQASVQKYGSEFQNIQTVRLGKQDQVTVLTDTAGVLWARQWNGKEIQVVNRAYVSADFDLRVLVGTKRTQPNKWFILESMEDYLVPAGGGRIAYHHTQHEFEGADIVWVNRKQIIYFSVIVFNGSAFQVQVYGGATMTPAGLKVLNHQVLTLSSYVPLTGALYVNIEVDDNMNVSYNVGTNFGSIAAARPSYVPVPAAGKYVLAYVMLYGGQTVLNNSDIVVPMPIGIIPKAMGLQINEAPADTPLDADKFGFWDAVDSALKSVTWSSIKSSLKTYFDTIYAPIVHTHTYPELLMETGVSNPPVPLENSDGTDWLYG